MQNIPQISQFMGYFYPIWVSPTTPQCQNQYSPFVNFYSTFFTPVPNHFPNQSSTPQGPVAEKIIEKQNDKPETIGVEESKNIQEKMVENLQVSSEKIAEVDEIEKSKKPILYKTQRSYFLKQKIKGGLKSNTRILRKRKLEGSSNSIKSKLRTSIIKKVSKQKKQVQKKERREQAEGQVKKRPRQLKIDSTLKFIENVAEVPRLVCGISQLNQLIWIKLQALKLRQIIKK